ncbi:hypothetical protein [Lentzea sp. NBRC 102530]|uniref:hypothetical protein n=1 Tax=Lentzea sp. NBRC 102530 TaxID=3032201 RepID=UPI0024A1AE19|nr:hypothetical protein [Lentzea sp. NBRC 102530]GLY53905.1 hypothetical protein Lesp01_75610 [Lentzea sp. NBRC 102530]
MLRLLPVLLLLTGCGVLENFNADVNEVGRQIIAHWKERPDVAAAQFEYRHGLDQGESVTVEVLVHADKITPTTVDELVEIARRDYWRGTSRDVGAGYLVYSTDDPPYADKPGEAEPIGQGRIEFDGDPAASYGPRPTRPSK